MFLFTRIIRIICREIISRSMDFQSAKCSVTVQQIETEVWAILWTMKIPLAACPQCPVWLDFKFRIGLKFKWHCWFWNNYMFMDDDIWLSVIHVQVFIWILRISLHKAQTCLYYLYGSSWNGFDQLCICSFNEINLHIIIIIMYHFSFIFPGTF